MISKNRHGMFSEPHTSGGNGHCWEKPIIKFTPRPSWLTKHALLEKGAKQGPAARYPSHPPSGTVCSMYVVVVGAGEVGFHIADILIAEGHDVALSLIHISEPTRPY